MDEYIKKRLDFLSKKFGMTKLQTEANGLPVKDDGRPLSEVVQELERDKAKGFKLSVASVPFQGKKVKVWYNIKK